MLTESPERGTVLPVGRLPPRTFGRRAPAFRDSGRRVRVIGGRGCTPRHGPTCRPRCGRCPERVVVPPDPLRWRAEMRPALGGVSLDRIIDAAAIQDVWNVLARARTDNPARPLTSTQDAVFRRYPPMARTPATCPGPGSWPVGPTDAELGWRPRRAGLAAVGQRRVRLWSRAAIGLPCAACRRRTSATAPPPPAPGGYPVTETNGAPGSGPAIRGRSCLQHFLVHVHVVTFVGVSVQRRVT